MKEEKQQKKKYKVLTLISGILTIIFALLLIAAAVMLVFSLIDSVNSTGDDAGAALGWLFAGWLIVPLFGLFVLFFIGIGITYIVLGSFLCSSSSKTDAVYLGRSGFVITTIVFDFIMAFIFMFCVYAFEGGYRLFYAVLMGISIISAVLKITDIALAKRRVRKDPSLVASNVQKNINFSALKSDSQKFSEELDMLAEKLKSGALTEEEYAVLKQAAIEKHTAKNN